MLASLAVCGGQGQAQPHEPEHCIFPEQRCLEIRAAEGLCPAEAPNLGRPKTVSEIGNHFEVHHLSLDEAIQIALANAEVIRVLSGTSVSSSGRTIYDPAVSNTDIDQQRAKFDPVLELGNGMGSGYSRNEFLGEVGGAIVTTDTEQFNFDARVSQMKANGGMARVGFNANPSSTNIPGRFPSTRSSLDFGYTRPLLRGRGVCVNLAPIVIARINTERSFYQLKDAVQELVRSVVDGYWSLVQARVDLWARKQQIEQLEYAFKRLDAQRRVELADLGDTAQAKVSLEQFRANLIVTEAQVLDLEAAFFNVMGLPPVPNLRLVPVTPPLRNPVETEWNALVATASEQRPDIIELKLSIEAIQQQLVIDCNNTLPQLDAVGLARVNGLSVDTPGGTIRSEPFQSTDVQFGLNLRTPLGQRGARASLRRQQLTLARERANLQQQLHSATHSLAQSLRSLEQFFKQYEAFKKVRDASKSNLDRRFQIVRVGGLPNEPLVYLDVLQAVTDWGNAVSSEAQALTRYNAEIANLERQAGIILARHSIMFDEEGYQSLAPFGHCDDDCERYPQRTPVLPNQPRYGISDKPSEEAFDLKNPTPRESSETKRELPSECEDLLDKLLEQNAESAEAQDSSGKPPLKRLPLEDRIPKSQHKSSSDSQTGDAILRGLKSSDDSAGDEFTTPIELIRAPAVFKQLQYGEAVPADRSPAEPPAPVTNSSLEYVSPAGAKAQKRYKSAVQTLQFLKRLPPTVN